MLTARNRQDHFGSPGNSLGQGIVRRSIAGMQGNHHIHPGYPLIILDIALQKCQFVIAIGLCQSLTVPDHLLLAIQAYDPYIQFLKDMQIIIDGKGQVGLAAAKIQDGNLPVRLLFLDLPAPFFKGRKNILDKLQKTVDLPELIISFPYDFPFLCHYAQVNQERNRYTLRQYIALSPIMIKADPDRLIPLVYSSGFAAQGNFTLLADQGGDRLLVRLHLQITIGRENLSQALHRRLPIKILMKDLNAIKALKLEDQSAPKHNRPKVITPHGSGLSRSADDHMNKPCIQFFANAIL